MFKYIEPEVSGGFGEGTELDNSVHPPIVKRLNFEFDGWLGSDIIESFPCYLVTEKLRNEIECLGLSGVNFVDVEVTITDEFREMYPDKKLPTFYWMKVQGKAGVEDFGLAEDHRLVISIQVQNLFSSFNLSGADFEDYA